MEHYWVMVTHDTVQEGQCVNLHVGRGVLIPETKQPTIELSSYFTCSVDLLVREGVGVD